MARREQMLSIGLMWVLGLMVGGPATWGAELSQVISLLKSSSMGKSRLERLPGGEHSIRWGEASRTDAVLTRQLDAETGKENRERSVTIFLRLGSSVTDAALDLAHELVHATESPEWDPYDPELTAERYIHAVIDGKGGEVLALASECQVALELESLGLLDAGRCQKYALPDDSGFLVDVEAIRKDFYRVGSWMPWLEKRLLTGLSEFPLISKDSTVFVSSTGRAPYPVALFREFDLLTKTACGNSAKRLERLGPSKQPGSIQESESRFLSRRCHRTWAGSQTP